MKLNFIISISRLVWPAWSSEMSTKYFLEPGGLLAENPSRCSAESSRPSDELAGNVSLNAS